MIFKTFVCPLTPIEAPFKDLAGGRKPQTPNLPTPGKKFCGLPCQLFSLEKSFTRILLKERLKIHPQITLWFVTLLPQNQYWICQWLFIVNVTDIAMLHIRVSSSVAIYAKS